MKTIELCPRDNKGRFVKGSAYRKGMKASKETRTKMSLAKKNRSDIKEWMNKIRPRLVKEKNHLWKGGKNIRESDGYVYLAKSIIEKQIYDLYFNHYRSRPVPEHQYVWVKNYGECIPKGYHIHHINRIKIDNRIENLLLMKAGDHSRLHFKKKSCGYED